MDEFQISPEMIPLAGLNNLAPRMRRVQAPGFGYQGKWFGGNNAVSPYTPSVGENNNPWSMGWGQMGLGGKMQTVGTGIQALASLYDIYSGLKAQKLAKEQFNFQKGFALTNLANQAKLANQALEANIRSRYAGGTTPQEQAELDRYRVSGTIGG